MTLTKYHSLLLAASMGAMITPTLSGAQTIHTIDVLGIYSNHVVGKLTDPEAAFVSNIEYANKALQNSGANHRYNLVHVQQQNWAQDDGIGSAQLNSMLQNSAIKALREEYGADVVAGMVPTSNGYCGIGYLPPADSSTHKVYSYANKYGYSLSGHSCGGRTMAHEIGHNMGLGHSAAQGSSGTVARWGRGHGEYNKFVTIMAYPSAYGVYSSGSLQIHANPSINVCQGQACGNPVNSTNAADAVQALNLASPQISQWRDSVVNVPVNNAPNAVNDSASTDAGTKVTINVLANDSDPDGDGLTLGTISSPKNGSAVANTAKTSILYTPATGFDGTDSFTYTVVDSRGAKAQATVTVQVNAVVTEPPSDPGSGSGTDSNLVVNGGVENGKTGWGSNARASFATSTLAHTGDKSMRVRASSGGGVTVDMRSPIKGNANLNISGWVKGDDWDVAYVYLRAKENGRWAYQYMTSIRLWNSAGAWKKFETTRYIKGADRTDGFLYFHFPFGTEDAFLIDEVSAKPE